MYERAYQMDFGANATAYIDTCFRNINLEAVLKRIQAVRNNQPLPNEDPSLTKVVPPRRPPLPSRSAPSLSRHCLRNIRG